MIVSCTLATVISSASGMFERYVTKCRFAPGLPRLAGPAQSGTPYSAGTVEASAAALDPSI